MRDKIIKMINGCLTGGDEWMKSYKFKNMTELKSYINSEEHSLLRAKRYYDDILKNFITILGLRFAIYHDGLVDWYKTSKNEPIDELERWEKIINGTSN